MKVKTFAMTKEQDISLAQCIHDITVAFQGGRLHVPEHLAHQFKELLEAPRDVMGVVDTTNLSSEAKAFARSTGLALRHFRIEENKKSREAHPSISLAEMQAQLFALFDRLFVALIGVDSTSVQLPSELKTLMMERVKDNEGVFARETNAVLDELGEFYTTYKHALYSHARLLGGTKFVTGGQRAFLYSALQGVRIAALYADTQLIPDPVYPYLVGDMHQNALHLQMANTLLYILQLKPLIDARLPVPPVFVFPSFELELETNDMVTKQGVIDLSLRLIAPACNATLGSMEELGEYARTHEESFITAVMKEQLFIPPGASPNERLSGEEAVTRYLSELEGRREAKMLADMRTLPPGILILNGIMERLGSQFHLIDNSSSLNAQPLLHQDVHWHYYVKCCEASAKSLVNKKILSEDSFQTVRALQDDSLGWLTNISIDGLVELARNQEHQWFRNELKQYTDRLASADSTDISDVLREVNHALSDLLQRHQKNIRDIEEKYSVEKKWTIAKAAGAGIGALTSLLPFLLPELGGAAASIAAAMGSATLGAIPVGSHYDKQWEEKQKANRSMLGMLAMAR